MWYSGLLTSGTHTLKVRVTGTKNFNSIGNYVAVDRVDINPTVTIVDDNTIGSGINQYNYNGNRKRTTLKKFKHKP